MGTPERLARFVAAEWPTTDALEAAGMWWAAREEWQHRTGRHAFLVDDPPPPDAPFDSSGI
jgi:hypothetical protein